MAKQRIVNTKFWDDSYIVGLNPTEKLLFLYLITNPLTNIAGVYELPLKTVAFDVGMKVGVLETIFKKFERDGKIVSANGWIGVVNFIKHQTLNPKVKQGIISELKKAPPIITDNLSIDYRRLSVGDDGLSHLNSNLNINSGSNGAPVGLLSTAFPQDLQEKRQELLKKYRL